MCRILWAITVVLGMLADDSLVGPVNTAVPSMLALTSTSNAALVQFWNTLTSWVLWILHCLPHLWYLLYQVSFLLLKILQFLQVPLEIIFPHGILMPKWILTVMISMLKMMSSAKTPLLSSRSTHSAASHSLHFGVWESPQIAHRNYLTCMLHIEAKNNTIYWIITSKISFTSLLTYISSVLIPIYFSELSTFSPSPFKSFSLTHHNIFTCFTYVAF